MSITIDQYRANAATLNGYLKSSLAVTLRQQTGMFPPFPINFTSHAGNGNPISLEVALRATPKAVFYGDGGSGKTTTFRYLAYRIAINELTLGERSSVPLMVELFGLPSELISQPDMLPEYLSSLYGYGTNLTLNNSFFRESLNRDDTVVLLDGLDEMQVNQGQQAAQFIKGVLDRFPQPKYVGVGSRPIITTAGSLEQIATYNIKPLSPDEILEFARRKFKIYAAQTSQAAQVEAVENASSLFLAETQNQFIGALSANPLFLEIIVNGAYQCTTLPNTVDGFAKESMRLYLSRWYLKTKDDAASPKLTVLEVTNLDRIAYELTKRGTRDASIDELAGNPDIFPSEFVRDGKIELTTDIKKRLLQSWANNSEFMMTTRPGYVAFSSKAYQEILAGWRLATKISHNNINEFVAENIRTPQWREPILWAVGCTGYNEYSASLFAKAIKENGFSDEEAIIRKRFGDKAIDQLLKLRIQ